MVKSGRWRTERKKREVKAKLADVHAHTISDVNDGDESLEEAIQMLQMIYNQGLRRIIASTTSGIAYSAAQRAGTGTSKRVRENRLQF